MGLKSLIAGQVQGAMKILGTDEDGLAAKRTYVSVDPNGGTYNYDTRTTEPAETQHAGIPMTFVRFQIDDMDAEVKPQTDRRALIAALDLPVEPNEQDYILDGTQKWNVRRILSDPSQGLYILHVRKV